VESILNLVTKSDSGQASSKSSIVKSTTAKKWVVKLDSGLASPTTSSAAESNVNLVSSSEARRNIVQCIKRFRSQPMDCDKVASGSADDAEKQTKIQLIAAASVETDAERFFIPRSVTLE
jgi:hypothetical protein